MTRHPWTETITSHRRMLDGLARAVQRPSLAERALVEAPRDRECVRCFGQLDDDRAAICRGCHEGGS